MKTRRALPSSRRLLLLALELILISSVTFSLTTTLDIRLRPHFLATSLTTANMTIEETTTLESRLYDLLTNHLEPELRRPRNGRGSLHRSDAYEMSVKEPDFY
jgi:hypothetical protein